MAREVIAIIKKDPKLLEYEARVAAADKSFKERMSFIEKQAENAYNEMVKDREVLLDELEGYLIASGQLEKPVIKDKQHLCFSHGGTIDIHSGTFHDAVMPNGSPNGGPPGGVKVIVMEMGRPPK